MNEQKIVNFFFEVATLRRLTRSHRQVISEVSDNISDHSFRVAVFSMIIAKEEGADVDKTLKMALFHDLLEARTGDANHINKRYVKMDEDRAIKHQLSGLAIEEEVLNLVKEYKKRESKEAVVAKDADLLDQMVLQQEYLYLKDYDQKRWQDYTEKNIKTETAKKLADKIRNNNPLQWLYDLD